ncbi:HET domain-containing protein [Nemania sp. FL0031]|nr:HET domain-containing protein [Nemania sp. FL0031]
MNTVTSRGQLLLETPTKPIYAHLDAQYIRLLRINKDTSCSFAGQLESVKVDEAPPYYALSYCWGSQSQQNTVPVGVGDGALNLSRELAKGIHRLKQLTTLDEGERSKLLGAEIEYVWIDKICINQTDIRERELQVQLMGKIYSNSIRTLIWLGSDDDNTGTAAWALVDRIYDAFRAKHPTATCLADIPLTLYSDKAHSAIGLPKLSSDLWTSFEAVLGLSWFTRIWVVQEVALSPQDPVILHGRHIQQWDRLGWTASWLRRSGYVRLARIPEAIRNIDSMANIRRSEKRWPLDVLLTDTSAKFHASDQRDKVYGLLGLASECVDIIPEPLQPDYGLDVAQAYKKIAVYLLQQRRSLSILTRTSGRSGSLGRRQRGHDLRTLPSWVPDWCDFSVVSREIAPSLSWIFYAGTSEPPVLGFPKHYTASGLLPASVSVSLYSNESTISLYGIKADELVLAIPFDGDLQPWEMFHQNFSTLLAVVWDTLAPLVAQHGPFLEQASRFIINTTAEQHGMCGREAHQILSDGLACLLDLLLRDEIKQTNLASIWQEDCKRVMTALTHLAIGGDPQIYMNLAKSYCFNRSFFITSRGYMGMGPADSQVGDSIVILYGGGVPYIIRRQESNWSFIGESYCYNVIHGEMIEARDRGDVLEEDFEFV